MLFKSIMEHIATIREVLGIKTAKLSRWQVFKKLKDEREYQQSRWDPTKADREYGLVETRLNNAGGGVAIERYHELGAWISFMETYLEEARDINSKSDNKDAALLKVRAVGALAVAALEQHGCPDRPGWVPPVVNGETVHHARPKEVPTGVPHHGHGCEVHGDQCQETPLRPSLREISPDCGNPSCPVHAEGGLIDQIEAGKYPDPRDLIDPRD